MTALIRGSASPRSPVNFRLGFGPRSGTAGSISICRIFSASSTPHSIFCTVKRVPSPMTRSHSGQRRCPCGIETNSGAPESTTPCPVRNAMTPAPVCSASARTASLCSCAPLPTTISGLCAALIKAAAASISSAEMAGAATPVLALTDDTPLSSPHTSAGTSTPTGPGQPDSMVVQAFAKAAGASLPCITLVADFVRCAIISRWPLISCSKPNPLPIARDGIWPISANSGAFSACAVHNAAHPFRKPGPGTRQNACGLPVASAAPRAI